MERNCNTCNTEKSQTKLDCKVCHYNINNTGWSVLNWTPKQENNVKRIWKNCDHASLHKWNGFKCVYYGNGECNCRFDSDTGSRMFELRRDYKQENKEQEMSYKPKYSGDESKKIWEDINKIGNDILDSACVELQELEGEVLSIINSLKETKGIK